MKKLAKKAESEMKRDLVKTGNKNLRKSTVRELQNSESLLALRKQMGPTAFGFQSNHCSYSSKSVFFFSKLYRFQSQSMVFHSFSFIFRSSGYTY